MIPCLLLLGTATEAAATPVLPLPDPTATTENVFKTYWSNLIDLSLKDIAAKKAEAPPLSPAFATGAFQAAMDQLATVKAAAKAATPATALKPTPEPTAAPMRAFWSQFIPPGVAEMKKLDVVKK